MPLLVSSRVKFMHHFSSFFLLFFSSLFFSSANVLLDHLYRSCCFKRNCCMLTLRPLVIGSRDVSDMFHKFVPVER